jgi:hypothetical protein
LTGQLRAIDEAGRTVRLYELRTPPMGGGQRNTVWKNRTDIDAIIHAPAAEADDQARVQPYLRPDYVALVRDAADVATLEALAATIKADAALTTDDQAPLLSAISWRIQRAAPVEEEAKPLTDAEMEAEDVEVFRRLDSLNALAADIVSRLVNRMAWEDRRALWAALANAGDERGDDHTTADLCAWLGEMLAEKLADDDRRWPEWFDAGDVIDAGQCEAA